MGPTSENIVMLNQQETKLTQQPTEQKIVINADGTVNQQASIDLANFQKNNLLNQKILINNESALVNNQQLLNDALNQSNLLANQKMMINNAETAGLLTQRIELSQHKTNHIPAASTNQIITNHIPVSSNQIIINNNGTLINTTGGSVDLKEFLSSQKLLNNIAIHTASSQEKQNHVLINNSDGFADPSGGKVKEENVSKFQVVNNVQKSEQQTQQVNGSSQPRKERTKTKTFNDVYTEHLQQQVNHQHQQQPNIPQQQQMTPPTSQYNSYSIEQKPGMIYISNNDQQQHSPQSQQSQNKFLEQQHVNNIVFNTNHNNNNNSTTSCNDTHHPSPTPPPPPSPAPSPTPMSFIPSKTLVNGSPVINDHTNRLQIVMDKPPTPTSGHYQETPTGTAHSQPQLLANKTQLQIVMDSQDHSQIALNDHQNRLQIVMNQPSPEAVLTSQPSPHQMTPTSIQSPLQITSSGLQITPSSLQSIQNSLQMTPSGLQITPSPLQITPTSLQAPLTRLNGSTSATHVQFVSPRTINTVIKTSQPQPTPLVNSTPLIPTSQSHPHLSLQPSSNPGSTEHKSPSFTPQTNSSYNGPTPISQSNPSYNGSTPQSTSCYTPGSTPPVFVNRPNLTVVTQPHPPVLLSSDHQNNDSSQSQQQQVPFRSMPQVCDTSPPSVITQTPTNNVRPQMKPPTPQPRPLPPTSGTHSSSPPHSNANTTQFPNPSSNSNNTHFNSSNNSSSGNTAHYNSSSSNAQNNAPYNSFLDTIAQQHPSILINKTLAPPSQPQPCNQPATSIIVKKPPVVKKSAVVKPMVMVAPNQEDGEPPSLVPLDGQNSSSVVQRVQTIQLTPQKQQHLKAVQNQITSLSAKDNKTSKDQATLQKLYKEQQSILLSGKIVPTIPGQHAQGLTFVSTPVRLVAPPTIPSPPTLSQPPQTGGGKSTSPVCVQVGTQTSDDSKSPPPVIAAPAEPSPSPHVTSSTTLSLSKRAALIEQQQARDILGATRPDTRTPFTSVSDAVKRLVRYHCLDDPVLSERDLSKADEIFEATAQHLLDKKAQMINKYKYLLIKESMRQVQTSELIMLGRMFVSDESAHLESLRQQAKNPPPTPTTTLVPSPCIDTPPSTISPSTSPSSSSCLKRDRDVDSPLYSRSEESGKRRCLGDDENETGRDECRDNEDMDMNDDGGVKTPGRCAGDDDEIKAQVQSAIDSILNLQRSDPATDEAVRSILGTGVTS
uniref:GLTSCR1-like protein n=2 Tax=Cacopsylla melanoneura TaxID=428564 RepID=A0A8D8LHR5_9HEMI